MDGLALQGYGSKSGVEGLGTRTQPFNFPVDQGQKTKGATPPPPPQLEPHKPFNAIPEPYISPNKSSPSTSNCWGPFTSRATAAAAHPFLYPVNCVIYLCFNPACPSFWVLPCMHQSPSAAYPFDLVTVPISLTFYVVRLVGSK